MSVMAKLVITPAATAKLRAITEAVRDVNPALLMAAQPIVNDAKQLCPVLTGTLRRSIRAEEFGPGDIRIGTDVAYGARIEFGFHDTDSLGRKYNQAAQPYLRPAFDQNRIETAQRVTEALKVMIRKAV